MKRILLLFLIGGFPLFLSSQDIRLEEFLGAPYCTHLTRSDNGNSIAWVSNEKGIRKVFIAHSPLFKSQEVFATREDDGQVIGNLTFDHKVERLHFVLGSSPNRLGESANPASLVNYPVQKLLSIDISTGVKRDLGPHPSYLIAPEDTYLLLPNRKNLSRLNLIDSSVTRLITMRGNFSDISFAPDGKKIVFTSNRGDHSFIGVFTFGKDRIQWISPSVDRDGIPQWSPDGNKIVFLRVPGGKRGELTDITSGTPFSIHVYDFESMKTQTIWTSPNDAGGFAQYYHSHPLRWTKGNKILFYSEHDGWMNIYVIDPADYSLNEISKGNCEVEHSDVNEAGDKLVFSSNCGDIDRRNLFIYDLGNGQMSQLTNTEDIETDPVFVRGDKIAYRHGGYNFPTGIGLVNQSIYPPSLPENFPKNAHAIPEQVIFSSGDSLTIHGQLFVKDKDDRKPALIFMHGGPIRQMLLGYHYSNYYANAYAFNQFLANNGYVVLSVNYRDGIGYGRDFRRAKNQGPRGASEYQDIVAGARFLQSLPFVDPDKIGLWGGSYGGLLTAQGLARNSDIFKVGVDFHGVHDWAWRAEDFSEGGFWGITSDLMEKAYNSSPVSEVDKWKSPVLFIHGDDDRNVMFGQSVDLVQKLREKGVYHEVLVLPDEVHGFYRWESWLRSYQATFNFFNQFFNP